MKVLIKSSNATIAATSLKDEKELHAFIHSLLMDTYKRFPTGSDAVVWFGPEAVLLLKRHEGIVTPTERQKGLDMHLEWIDLRTFKIIRVYHVLKSGRFVGPLETADA